MNTFERIFFWIGFCNTILLAVGLGAAVVADAIAKACKHPNRQMPEIKDALRNP